MKAEIEVENKQEADLICAGLADPTTLAIVKVIAALQPLTNTERVRVLDWACSTHELFPSRMLWRAT